MSSFDRSTHKLEGSSSSEAGGLIVKSSKAKSDSGASNEPTFKKPTTSLLGLDRLARRKREEREAEAASFPEKRPKLHSKEEKPSNSYDSDLRISFGKSARAQDGARDRKYRGAMVETPSHTGGVDEEALQRMHSRLAGRDQRGHHRVYASTSRGKDGGREDVRRSRLVSERW